MEHNIKNILSQFNLSNGIEAYGEGHINDTYLAVMKPHQYIIQRINHNVFENPHELMENIVGVTQHIRSKIKQEGGDPTRETLTVIKTLDGNDYYKDSNGNFYRAYIFIENTDTYQIADSPSQLYELGKGFSKFQKQLSDFPAHKLHETVKNFHNTRARFEQLRQAINNDVCQRKKLVEKEIAFAFEREKDVDKILIALENNEIPLRVTHNDTKLNNILFDKKTKQAVCVIDLDTVMSGSLLYDYGDSIRFGASSGAEDEENLDKIYCDLELFEAFTKGYLYHLSDIITKNELELLAFASRLMTYECGLRFLADYLNGDIYFKIHKENHNLHRARTQFKLVEDMELKEEKMEEIVSNIKNNKIK